MTATLSLSLTLDELLAIRDYVRMHGEYGRVWDRRDMLRVHEGILELSALPREKQGEARYALEVDESFLWLMEQQVPRGLMVGTRSVGHELLLKVLKALEEIEQGAVGTEAAAAERPNALPPDLEAFLEEVSNGGASKDQGHDAGGNALAPSAS